MNNKAISRVTLGALLVGSGAIAGVTAQDTAQVTVVATTDIHGRVTHWDYLNGREAPWGLTRAATVVDSLRQFEDPGLVLVDAGDFLQGSPFASYHATQERLPVHPVIDGFNALRYDVVVLGNHEFDFGLDVLDSALDKALFRPLSANYYIVEREAPVYRSYAVLERNGVRIGVAGLTTPGTKVWHRSKLGDHHDVFPIPGEAERVLGELADEDVDFKVVVVHSGLAGPSTYQASGTGEENRQARRVQREARLRIQGKGHQEGHEKEHHQEGHEEEQYQEGHEEEYDSGSEEVGRPLVPCGLEAFDERLNGAIGPLGRIVAAGVCRGHHRHVSLRRDPHHRVPQGVASGVGQGVPTGPVAR